MRQPARRAVGSQGSFCRVLSCASLARRSQPRHCALARGPNHESAPHPRSVSLLNPLCGQREASAGSVRAPPPNITSPGVESQNGPRGKPDSCPEGRHIAAHSTSHHVGSPRSEQRKQERCLQAPLIPSQTRAGHEGVQRAGRPGHRSTCIRRVGCACPGMAGASHGRPPKQQA